MQHNQTIEASAKLHAAAIRAKLFNAKERPLTLAAPVKPKPRPVYQQDYADVLQMPVWRRPFWARVDTTFNNHVIDFRQMLWGIEADAAEQVYFRRSMVDICLEVLVNFPGITLQDIRGPRRNRQFVLPRHMSMYRIKCERADLSYPSIGKFFGGRDHTTLMYAVGKIEQMIKDGRI